MLGVSFTADKFGYYKVGDRSTYSKFEAHEWASQTNEKVEWDFNRSTFDFIDWSKEPKLDLWELYKTRARQIREAYDYVVLWYSGGSDSHNLLLAWIDAGLKIDEIATTVNYEATSDYQNHYNAEITNVVIPDIEKLKNAGHEFKFRVIDISKHSLDLFTKFGNEFEYQVNFHFSINNPARNMFRENIEDYKNLIAQGKKLCFVWGKEKPIIRLDNGRYYASFCDNVDNCVGPHVQRNYWRGWYDELFYWTPDLPELPVKQAHALLKFVKNVHNVTCYEPREHGKFQPNGINTNPYGPAYNMHLKDEIAKLVLYPKWSNDIFCNGKASSFTYSLRDEWFLNSNLENKNRFMQITNSYFKIVDPKEVQNRRNILPYYSPKYWLE